MSKVYRVEHIKRNVGPYKNGMAYKWLNTVHNKKTGRPVPFHDRAAIKRFDSSHYFGYKRISDLKRWFSRKSNLT